MTKRPETMLRKLLEESPIGVAILDLATGKRLFINTTFAKMIGAATPDDLIESDITGSWANPDDRKRAFSAIRGGQALIDFEVELKRTDGSRCWVLMNSQPIIFDNCNANIIWHTDITKRKAVQEQAEHFGAAIDQLSESVVIFDEEDRIVMTNGAWKELNSQIIEFSSPGTTFEDCLRAGMEKGQFPESTGHEEEWLRKRMERHRNPTGPFVVARQNGRWIRVHEQRLSGGGAILIISDITELKQGEALVQESEEKLREILENSPMGVGIVTYVSKDSELSGQRLFVNPALLQMLGATSEEQLQKLKIEDSWVDLDQLRAAEKSMKNREDLVNLEVKRRRVDGTEWWALMNSRRIDFKGHECKVIWHADITESKLADEALRASEARLEGILKIAPEAVIVMGSDLTILNFNQSAERIFGYSSDEVLGQSINMLLPPHFREAYTQYINEFSDSPEDFRMMDGRNEVSAIRKDGSSFLAAASLSKFKINDEKVFVALLHDITESKRAEVELLVSKEKAEVANRAKSEFLANMSHEIRTPMNGVIGMVDILTQMDMEPEPRRMIQTIRNSSFSLLRIIDDILDASKIEAGKLGLENVPVQLHQIIEDVIETITPTADSSNVRLSLFIDPSIPKWIYSDAGRLRQVMLNLFGNAVKFSRGKDGVIGKVACLVELFENDSLQFKIIDDGIGMSKTVLSNLFKPFTQGEESTTRTFGGTGLGLIISDKLVKLMGGTIKVESIQGEGSTFTVTLPFAEADIPTINPDISGLNLLVLGDDDMRRETITGYVEPSGSTVRFAESETELASWVAADEGESIIILSTETMAKNDRIRKALSVGPKQRLFLQFSANRSDTFGVVQPNCYVIRRHPILPSEFFLSLAVLADRESPALNISVEEVTSLLNTPRTGKAEAQNALILVVEDNETNQEVIMYQLDILGYAAELADNGQQGLEMWQTGRFDLILSDCHMPVMDGFKMTDAIRNIEKQKSSTRTPIVAITANALQGEAGRCLAAGMDDYISKPMEMKRLEQTIGHWLTKEIGD